MQTTRKFVCRRPNNGKSTCIVILFFSVVWMTKKKSLSRNRLPAETHSIPRMSCSKMRIVLSRPSTILVSNGTEGVPVRKCFKPKVLDTAASPGFKRREFPDVLHSVVLVVHNHVRTGFRRKQASPDRPITAAIYYQSKFYGQQNTENWLGCSNGFLDRVPLSTIEVRFFHAKSPRQKRK